MFFKSIQETGESDMNIDCTIQQTSLKRSSSAPMINKISSTMSMTSPTTSAPRDATAAFNTFTSSSRARRFSTSCSGGSIGLGFSPNNLRLTPRINQLRREECIEVVAGREAAHEKEIHSAMQISQSWEDLTFEAEGVNFKDSIDSPTSSMISGTSLLGKADKHLIQKKIFDPLSGSSACSSPSPTRSLLGQRQCYSPSFHAVTWKNGSLSPSPTRKAFATRRSLSPISIRPSYLGGNTGPVKRKFELDESSDRLLHPPAKRIFSLVMSNPSRAENSLSPFSSLKANSGGSVGTPESLSSADSPNFCNQLADDSPIINRALIQNDEVMSDISNDSQPIKQMESDSLTDHSSSYSNDR